MMWFYHLANVVLRGLFAILLDYRVTGLENVPRTGPLIVAINHTSFLDPLLVGVFIPREVTMMGKAELFRIPVFGLIARLYGAFPVRRGEIDRGALRRAMEVLQEGGALMMAPEGTRGGTEQLQRGRHGVTMIALRTGAAILPVAIWGPKRFPTNLARLRRTRVGMAVGEPFTLKKGAGKPSREEVRAMTDEIMYRLAALLPPEVRGVYSDLTAAREDHLLPLGVKRAA
ncbi:MAG TPA: 1-acyl-sn-glycerol-3-phosphate acyltransferase [Anaerolineae bacterium]|nr:1-acyl-sn-glycerol-3-phosphate acyltransferase [Anaerolineae bacterium]